MAIECIVGGARLAGYFNARSPTETIASLGRLPRLLFLLFGIGRIRATDVKRLARCPPSQGENHDKAKARERKPAFHVFTTLFEKSERPTQATSRTGSPAVLFRCHLSR
jgi:hypothetical protein